MVMVVGNNNDIGKQTHAATVQFHKSNLHKKIIKRLSDYYSIAQLSTIM